MAEVRPGLGALIANLQMDRDRLTARMEIMEAEAREAARMAKLALATAGVALVLAAIAWVAGA